LPDPQGNTDKELIYRTILMVVPKRSENRVFQLAALLSLCSSAWLLKSGEGKHGRGKGESTDCP
jgi:hypothetical protein